MLECMLDYCRVFFKYARIEKAKERFCLQGVMHLVITTAANETYSL